MTWAPTNSATNSGAAAKSAGKRRRVTRIATKFSSTRFATLFRPAPRSSPMALILTYDFQDWNGKLIAQDGADLSYLTTHFVVGVEDLVNKSADHEARLAAGFALPVGVGNELAAAKAQIDANPATRGRVKLAFTEWLFYSPPAAELANFSNLGGAIITAGWMNMIFSHADFVPISDMTGLLEFGGHPQAARACLSDAAMLGIFALFQLRG